MSDDLVTRLRELNTFEWHARPATTKEICFAAADLIEKLEAALRAIIVHCEVPAPPNAEALIMFARQALEGNNYERES